MNFWVMAVVGAAAFVWLVWELVRVWMEVAASGGLAAVPMDGVIQHKVGELMVGGPLFAILLLANVWSGERVARLISRLWPVTIIGGLLNAAAWFTLRERMEWDSFFRTWCLLLLVVGLLGGPIVRSIVARAGRTR